MSDEPEVIHGRESHGHVLLERWLHLEDDVLGIAGHRDRLVRPGSGSGVCLTAPHAVPHRRGDRTKRADMWSGGLVLLLAELSGASAVVETSGLGDPSWEDHAFKEALGALTPRLVIDVHAMVDTDPVVEIGTGLDDGAPMPVIASRLVSALDDQGIRTRVDDRFPARREHTVVQWARRAGIDALQIEVSTRLVPPFVSEPEAQRFIGAMSRFIARA